MPRKPKFQHRKKKELEKRLLRQDQPQATTVFAPVVVAQESSHECSSITSLHDLHTSLVLPSKVWTDLSPDDLGSRLLMKVAAVVSNHESHTVWKSIQIGTLLKWLRLRRGRSLHVIMRLYVFWTKLHNPTLSTSKCEVLCTTVKCCACTKYRPVLRSMYHRWSKKDLDATPATFTNERYINTPQRKEKMSKWKKRVHVAE